MRLKAIIWIGAVAVALLAVACGERNFNPDNGERHTAPEPETPAAPVVFQRMPNGFISPDARIEWGARPRFQGFFRDSQSGEELLITSAFGQFPFNVLYAKNRQAAWVPLYLKDYRNPDSCEICFSGATCHQLRHNLTTDAITCHNPDGSVQTFTRVVPFEHFPARYWNDAVELPVDYPLPPPTGSYDNLFRFAEDFEEKCLNGWRQSAKRTGDTLRITLGDNSYTFTNRIPVGSIPSSDVETFYFQGISTPLRGAYVLEGYYEGSTLLLIHESGNDTALLNNFPILSPNQQYFIDYTSFMYQSKAPFGFAVYQLAEDGYLLSHSQDPFNTSNFSTYDHPVWVGNDTIAVMRQVHQSLDSAPLSHILMPSMLVRQASGRWVETTRFLPR